MWSLTDPGAPRPASSLWRSESCRLVLLFGRMLFVFLFALPAATQDPADFFRRNCISCHTIGGGPLTGPDLKDTDQRKDRQWLVEFLVDPPAMIAKGDPYALQLQQAARGVVMPRIAGLDQDLAQRLLDMIHEESELSESQFQGIQLGDKPFTAQDIAQGREIFLGTQALENGGPTCVACHSVSGSRGLGGGKLGPDLTQVYERLGGSKNLAAWLMAPATVSMQAIFRQHPLTPKEIPPLVAYLEDAAKNATPADSVGLLYFFLLALGGTVLGLVFFDTAWRHRLRGVRKALVEGMRQGEKL